MIKTTLWAELNFSVHPLVQSRKYEAVRFNYKMLNKASRLTRGLPKDAQRDKVLHMLLRMLSS